MSIVNESISESIDIWDKFIESRFLVQMQNGSLPKDSFCKYIIQDSLYLRDYIRCYSYALIKSESLKHMQFFSSSINYINDSENSTRLKYLKDFNLTDNDIDKMEKTEECKNYTEFLLNIAKYKDVPSILMSVLPCMLGYNYVFEKISKRSPNLLYGYYSPLIGEYISEEYLKVGEEWTNFTDDLCKNFSFDKKKDLKTIFRNASIHELLFWEMLL